MAVLEDDKGRAVTLGPQALVGRAPHCGPRIDDPRVSWDHAKIGWARNAWWLRDLNSTNGTWVDGRRLASADRIQLVLDQKLVFGHRDICWHVVSVDSPRFRLRATHSEAILCPESTLIALPSEEEPELTLYLGAQGWCVDDGVGVSRKLVDQEVLGDGRAAWRVEMPPYTDEVAETGMQREWQLEDFRTVRLSLRVSADREQIPAVAAIGARVYTLPSRASHELLLVLAEARLNDQRQGVKEPEAGWITVEDAALFTGAEVNKLNLDIFRLRREFEGMPLKEPYRVVERRPSVRQLRLGTALIDLEYEQ